MRIGRSLKLLMFFLATVTAAGVLVVGLFVFSIELAGAFDVVARQSVPILQDIANALDREKLEKLIDDDGLPRNYKENQNFREINAFLREKARRLNFKYLYICRTIDEDRNVSELWIDSPEIGSDDFAEPGYENKLYGIKKGLLGSAGYTYSKVHTDPEWGTLITVIVPVQLTDRKLAYLFADVDVSRVNTIRNSVFLTTAVLVATFLSFLLISVNFIFKRVSTVGALADEMGRGNFSGVVRKTGFREIDSLLLSWESLSGILRKDTMELSERIKILNEVANSLGHYRNELKAAVAVLADSVTELDDSVVTANKSYEEA